MNEPSKSWQDEETTALGTLGWVGVLVLFAILALVVLSALGPSGAP